MKFISNLWGALDNAWEAQAFVNPSGIKVCKPHHNKRWRVYFLNVEGSGWVGWRAKSRKRWFQTSESAMRAAENYLRDLGDW